VFCCSICGAQVGLVVLMGDILAYECQSPRCGKTVSVDIPEGLAVRDELAIELPAPRVRVMVSWWHADARRASRTTPREAWPDSRLFERRATSTSTATPDGW
jgi:hypothetical protein